MVGTVSLTTGVGLMSVWYLSRRRRRLTTTVPGIQVEPLKD